jgi:hypothetical protein
MVGAIEQCHVDVGGITKPFGGIDSGKTTSNNQNPWHSTPPTI